MGRYIRCLTQATFKTIEHDGIEHAGYMAFMILLSIFPFVIFFLASSSFLGVSELGKNGISMLLSNLPMNISEALVPRIHEILDHPPQSLLTLAILGTIWTSSSFVEGIRTILNRVHQVNSPPPYWLRRLLSIVQFLITSMIIFLTIVLLVFIPIILRKIPPTIFFTKTLSPIWGLLRYVFIVTTLFFTVSTIYYFVPNTNLKFIEVVPGAIVTVMLWIFSGTILSKSTAYYSQLNLIYGSLGSIIITLLFFHIIAIIFIYGAEFNHQLLRKNSKKYWCKY
ncbi:YihY/virulence factor BrkB family protein [Candidatus Orientia mediorientalis]|uniref:YihY/virulence factor BrkB family protein n=1 Tax=Candidatus Orientia mediorientalis TaxID=911112 RepID=UPI00351D0F1E